MAGHTTLATIRPSLRFDNRNSPAVVKRLDHTMRSPLTRKVAAALSLAVVLGALVVWLVWREASQQAQTAARAAWAREVGGNPFFISEMVRHLADAGDLYRDENGRWATTRPIRELEAVPAS